MVMESFSQILARHNLTLSRSKTDILQVNVGLLCNQSCRHCHLEAGPTRKEVMDRRTMDQIIAFAERGKFAIIDITGGAPEMVAGLEYLIESLAPLTQKLMLRSNLTALADRNHDGLLSLCQNHSVAIVASFPSTNERQTESQRGRGVLERSVEMLRKLNTLGYGRNGSRLELNLVSNPAGAFLPTSQCQAEKRFKQELNRKWSITFNNLHTFANIPLGRFGKWLTKSGNYEGYLQKLSDSFNPETLKGLMCRNLLSVSWDGYLYDCDFNQAAGLYLSSTPKHVSEMDTPPEYGTPIAVGDHCYACTAGSGFT